jgi:hypothetical protein
VLEVQLDRIDRKGKTLFADFTMAQRLIQNAPNDDLRYVLFCGFHAGMRKLEIVEAVPEWFNLSARTVELPHCAVHPSARVDADLMSTTGVPSNTSIGPIFTRYA